jgi:hypothetical protein
MRMRFRMDYLNKIYHRYHKSNSTDKTKMLDEFCTVCGYVRKYAIRKLNAPLLDNDAPKPAQPGNRKKTYLKETTTMLEIIWKATNYLCSVRLHAAIPIWLPYLKDQYHVSKKVSAQLLTISPSTIDRCLKDKKQKLKRKLYGTTKPGSLLKHQIPIKTGPWDTSEPGFTEVDLVSHSGNSADGDFIHSCNITDIFSGWTETRAIENKGQLATLQAIRDIQQHLPFKLRGIDSDNGSEFINHHLFQYCLDHHIDFTRSRPYKKDDNAHIEQKNWTCVRKLFGYLRYDSPEALHAINDLYRNELKLLQNLFLPSQKLINKLRVGSRYVRKYDKSQTPLQRLRASHSKNIDHVKLKRFTELFSSLNPFLLSVVIDNKINSIYKLASKTRLSKVKSLNIAA